MQLSCFNVQRKSTFLSCSFFQDDVRGDAVMQQVFEYVNALFAEEKTGRDKNLRIVTYNILPTSPTTGVSSNLVWEWKVLSNYLRRWLTGS